MMRKNASSAGRHLTVAVVRIVPQISIVMAQVATSAYGAAPYLLVVAAHIVQQESTKSNFILGDQSEILLQSFKDYSTIYRVIAA